MAVQIDTQKRNAEHAFKLISVRLASLFSFFEQEGVTEVNLNGNSRVFITRYGNREPVLVPEIPEITVAAAVRELAGTMGQDAEANSAAAIVDAKMPGYRFSAVLAPVASNGTMLSIRKHNPRVLSLEDYIKSGLVDRPMADLIATKVREGANILIGGATDSGKTTFLNALSREIPPNERVGTIEDTRELNLAVEDWFPYETNAQRGITATLMLKAAMRHSPHRLICGEVRDGVAADFIDSTNTGHHGCMATVHCTSAYSALERMEDLCLKGESDAPLLAHQLKIGRAINYVVHLKKVDGVRRLSEIVEVAGYDPSRMAYRTKPLYSLQEQLCSPLPTH